MRIEEYFLSLKPKKVGSDFILIYLNKVVGDAIDQKYQKVRLLDTKSVLTMLLPSDTGHFELCTLVESFRRFSCSLGPFGIHSKLGYM